MATYLDRIVAAHRAVAERDDRPLDELRRRADRLRASPGLRPRPGRAASGWP